MGPAVELQEISKSYPIYHSPADRLKELATFQRATFHDEFWALRDVSFDVRKGEAFGVIGQNGSGKSTLLQIVAGILAPTSGTVDVHGRLAAILELGTGFNPEFTGRQNVYLNASVLGLNRDEIDQHFDAIRGFADIGEFIDQPIKTYSTGMVMRLAFAVSIHVNPDILVVDEALAVGDIAFRQRCMRRIHELRASGVTILFVSHETGDVKALCERCVWLDGGRVRGLGAADEVVAAYLAAMTQKDAEAVARHPEPERRERLSAPEFIIGVAAGGHRYGDKRAVIAGVALTDETGAGVAELRAGDRAVVRISIAIEQEIGAPIAGFILRDDKGVTIFGTNTTRERRPLGRVVAGDTLTVDFHFTAPELAPGEYTMSAAVSDGGLDRFQVCDYVEDALRLKFAAERPVRGYLRLPYRVRVVD